MNKRYLILIVLFLLNKNLFADNQFFSETLDHQGVKTIDEEYKDVKGDNIYFGTPEDSQYLEKLKSTNDPYVNPKGEVRKSKITDEEELSSFGQQVGKDLGNEDQLQVTSSKELLDKIYNVGNQDFSFYFVYDQYSYQNDANNFDLIFREANRGRIGAQFLVSYQKYLTRSGLEFSLGMLTGVGYNTGKSRFKDETQSADANFNLWNIPFDALIGIDLPFGSLMKISLSGGPGAMLLMQRRSDLDDTDNRKSLRQFGYGFVYQGALEFSLSGLLGNRAIDMYSQFRVTKSYVSLFIRGQNYGSFKEPGVGVNGVSYGLGFSFEFI